MEFAYADESVVVVLLLKTGELLYDRADVRRCLEHWHHAVEPVAFRVFLNGRHRDVEISAEELKEDAVCEAINTTEVYLSGPRLDSDRVREAMAQLPAGCGGELPSDFQQLLRQWTADKPEDVGLARRLLAGFHVHCRRGSFRYTTAGPLVAGRKRRSSLGVE